MSETVQNEAPEPIRLKIWFGLATEFSTKKFGVELSEIPVYHPEDLDSQIQKYSTLLKERVHQQMNITLK